MNKKNVCDVRLPNPMEFESGRRVQTKNKKGTKNFIIKTIKRNDEQEKSKRELRDFIPKVLRKQHTKIFRKRKKASLHLFGFIGVA